MEKKHILVIEDDNHMRDFIAEVLMQMDCNVTACSNFEFALRGFIKSNYDLVISDVFMDGIGGIEGIELIRKQDQNVPILAISAGYEDMSAEHALLAAEKIGANEVLAKPFTEDQLTETVNRFLRD